ncbi:hypothetical protein LIER_13127 [Lithospermum erythrorhizon]|uniref:Amino acid transporter transmembrane domain-containing protein n=1 Tax=Lithospermum erythrorhizon TaxID=34254 RepID=A0AAV3PWG1_LITER
MDSFNIDKTESQNEPQQSLQQGASFVRTCFNGLNILAGVGILSFPYALSKGGWLSVSIFLFVAALCCYTGLLLQRCMDSNQLIKTYPDIGEIAFGRNGRTFISTFMYLELYLVSVEFLILEGDNLHKLFPNANLHVYGHNIEGKQVFILLTGLIILPTTWLRNLGLLAYVSAGGVVACVVLVCSVVWVGVFDGVGFHEKGELWQWSGLPTSTSLFTFCYCGHAVFPTLYTSMKEKHKFPKVLLVCFFLSTLLYGSMGIFGYLMYGRHLTSQITLNLPINYLSSKIAIYITLVNPITKYALVISPITNALEDKFSFNKSRSISILSRTSLVVSTIFVALVIPFFGYVMAFIGAFLSVTVSILFPCLCYLKLNKSSRKLGTKLIISVTILVFGVCVATTGTYTSMRDIIRHVQPS